MNNRNQTALVLQLDEMPFDRKIKEAFSVRNMEENGKAMFLVQVNLHLSHSQLIGIFKMNFLVHCLIQHIFIKVSLSCKFQQTQVDFLSTLPHLYNPSSDRGHTGKPQRIDLENILIRSTLRYEIPTQN
ncbi:hypothetical protein D915_009608 [Fasciola hepatica]|uniref:Uncharacterized protein n=1 Tax=Fasciola hepatica TaxID=6192 RepID=A0A4E0QZB1_FASHE|nr:hypothetical protein D915_009608 [Fasciola hepatica]